MQTFPVPALRASFDLSTEFGVSLALALQPHPLSPWRRRVCLALRLAAPLVIPVEKKKPIDKSCLMVCVKWVGDNCEKFEMKCKGEPGYPTANQATQVTTSGTTGTDPGTKGTQGIRGRPNVKGNAATMGN